MSARPNPLVPPPSPLMASLVRHYDDLVAYVRARFGRPAFARDVVQDVCLRLVERPQPDVIRHPLALLRRMTHDAAVDHCRSEDARRRWIEDDPDAVRHVACPAPDQLRQAEGRQALALLVAAIQSMPTRRQQVFVLHRIHDIPQKEVAARMGISLKTVEKHLRLAAFTCRQALEQAQA